MPPINAIRYIGKGYVPQELRRRRRQAQETMRRMGTPVIVKHMYNDRDVTSGVAIKSPNYDDVYGQTRNEDPLSHGVGFASAETSPNEWISPLGELVISASKPSATHIPAPKYRGFGPGHLIYIIEPDVAEDVFKVTEQGALIKVQDATAQAPWYPEINDNDLIINVELGRNEEIVMTRERYQAKMSSPTSMRGFDRKGRRETTEDGGNRYMIGQSFTMALVPPNNVLYEVETDR